LNIMRLKIRITNVPKTLWQSHLNLSGTYSESLTFPGRVQQFLDPCNSKILPVCCQWSLVRNRSANQFSRSCTATIHFEQQASDGCCSTRSRRTGFPLMMFLKLSAKSGYEKGFMFHPRCANKMAPSHLPPFRNLHTTSGTSSSLFFSLLKQ
jgi:hypothetical protein